MNRKRGEGLSLKGGKEGWVFVLGGPPCAALERREFQKVTLSNLFYLSLEVGRVSKDRGISLNQVIHWTVKPSSLLGLINPFQEDSSKILDLVKF